MWPLLVLVLMPIKVYVTMLVLGSWYRLKSFMPRRPRHPPQCRTLPNHPRHLPHPLLNHPRHPLLRVIRVEEPVDVRWKNGVGNVYWRQHKLVDVLLPLLPMRRPLVRVEYYPICGMDLSVKLKITTMVVLTRGVMSPLMVLLPLIM